MDFEVIPCQGRPEELCNIVVNLLCCCRKTYTKGGKNKGNKYKKVARKTASMSMEATLCLVSGVAEGLADS
ncbi:hypothetical protein DPMN_183007 [Dreissena polymorpha]|uniref:Uncharacterized protein n=1 Tax=Dreissena polymorpha TaxID=45954 RepID=A0A9D4DGT5_DREPO|nr:hypothetical protein DPMN_183007 [Dreissena polymorpha]